MKPKIIITSIAALIIVVIIFVSFNFKGIENKDNISGLATETNTVISPSGEYELKIIGKDISGLRCNKFLILKVKENNSKQKIIYTSNDAFRCRDTLYFVWGKDDTVWVYSGDVGIFFWKRINDVRWEKYTYSENKNVPVPDLLKKLRPNCFE